MVPPDRLREAYDALMQAGASRIRKYGYEGSIDAAIDLDVKHLPSLLSTNGKTTIEVHNYLFSADITHNYVEMPDLSRDSGLWDRRISREVARRRVEFCSRADLLIHVIVHAVHDHKFDNGPLLLSDIAFLLKSEPIDWEAFWATAGRLGKVPACVLSLRLAERAWGDLGIEYCEAAGTVIGEGLLDQAQSLMFYDIENKFGRNLSLHLNAEDTLAGKLRYLASRIFRPRTQVASLFNVDPGSPMVFFYYPLLYARLVSRFVNVMMKPGIRKLDNPRAVAEIESIDSFLKAR